MREIVKRPRAKEDLKDIWRYSFLEWGEMQAEKYLAEMAIKIEELQLDPYLGRPREDLRAGYRSLRIDQHVVYYVVTPSVIRIVRVFHVRMDPFSYISATR
jgi:toxin ParE1/3/4